MTRPTFPSRRVRRIFCSLSRDRCLFVLSVLGVKRATERWQKPLGRRCQSPTVKRHFSPQYDALARHSPKGVPAEEALCAWGGWGPSPKLGPESPRGHTQWVQMPQGGQCHYGQISRKRPLAPHPLSLSSPAAAFGPCSRIVSFIRFRFQLQGLSSKFLRHSKILSLQ